MENDVSGAEQMFHYSDGVLEVYRRVAKCLMNYSVDGSGPRAYRYMLVDDRGYSINFRYRTNQEDAWHDCPSWQTWDGASRLIEHLQRKRWSFSITGNGNGKTTVEFRKGERIGRASTTLRDSIPTCILWAALVAHGESTDWLPQFFAA